MSDWAAGMYTVSLRVAKPDLPAWLTNGVPIALAPRITVNPLNATAGNLNLTVTCAPRLRPGQEALSRLISGTSEIAPDSITTPGDPLQPENHSFAVTDPAAANLKVWQVSEQVATSSVARLTALTRCRRRRRVGGAASAT